MKQLVGYLTLCAGKLIIIKSAEKMYQVNNIANTKDY